jgi:hypothetical protein
MLCLEGLAEHDIPAAHSAGPAPTPCLSRHIAIVNPSSARPRGKAVMHCAGPVSLAPEQSST